MTHPKETPVQRRPLLITETTVLTGRPAHVLLAAARIPIPDGGDWTSELHRRYDCHTLEHQVDLTDRTVILVGRPVAVALGTTAAPWFAWQPGLLGARRVCLIPHPDDPFHPFDAYLAREAVGRVLRSARRPEQPAVPLVQLPQEARQVLAELELVSCGTIPGYEPMGRSGATSSKPPVTGDTDAPHLRWRLEMLAAPDQAALAAIVEKARDELAVLRRGDPDRRAGAREETGVERARRLLRDGGGFTPGELARSSQFRGMSEREIRAARVQGGQDPDLGRPTATGGTDVAAHAIVLLAGGMTVRQVALATGMSKSAVDRLQQTRRAA